MNPMKSDDAAWAAGVISVMGRFENGKVFRVKKHGQEVYARLVFSSRNHREVADRLAGLMGVQVKEKLQKEATVYSVQVIEDELHEFMKAIWDNLPRARRQEYAKIRAASRASVVEDSTGA